MFSDKEARPILKEYSSTSFGAYDIVNVKIARLLKKIGFNELCEFAYIDGVDDVLIVADTHKGDEELFPAPTTHMVKEWLKRQGVIINIISESKSVELPNGKKDVLATDRYMRVIYVKRSENEYKRYKRPVLPFITEKDALDVSIREALKYLERRQKQ